MLAAVSLLNLVPGCQLFLLLLQPVVSPRICTLCRSTPLSGFPMCRLACGQRARRACCSLHLCLLAAVGAPCSAGTLIAPPPYPAPANPAPQVRPGLAKMAVKGMWAYMQSYEAALR